MLGAPSPRLPPAHPGPLSVREAGGIGSSAEIKKARNEQVLSPVQRGPCPRGFQGCEGAPRGGPFGGHEEEEGRSWDELRVMGAEGPGRAEGQRGEDSMEGDVLALTLPVTLAGSLCQNAPEGSL